MEANFFQGTNTYGTRIHVATNGIKWFSRALEYNGYGLSWTKWEETENPVFVKNREEPTIKWGWNELRGFVNNRVRLPKN